MLYFTGEAIEDEDNVCGEGVRGLTSGGQGSPEWAALGKPRPAPVSRHCLARGVLCWGPGKGPTGSPQGKDPGLCCVCCRPLSCGDCCARGGLLPGDPAAPVAIGRANSCPPVARSPKKGEAVFHRRRRLKQASTAPSYPVTLPEAFSIITKPWAAASGLDCGDEVLFCSVLVEICYR